MSGEQLARRLKKLSKRRKRKTEASAPAEPEVKPVIISEMPGKRVRHISAETRPLTDVEQVVWDEIQSWERGQEHTLEGTAKKLNVTVETLTDVVRRMKSNKRISRSVFPTIK